MNLKSKTDILVRNLLGSVVPIIAHDASFERRLLEQRLPVFTPLAVEMSPATLLPREGGWFQGFGLAAQN